VLRVLLCLSGTGCHAPAPGRVIVIRKIETDQDVIKPTYAGSAFCLPTGGAWLSLP
jgi:hypothetical protein